jgi:hypothetical protein
VLQTALEFQFAARAPSCDVLDILANTSAKRREPALADLRAGLQCGCAVAYIEAGQVRNTPGGIPALSAVVLGPTCDEAFLRRMDLPKAERFLARRPREDGRRHAAAVRQSSTGHGRRPATDKDPNARPTAGSRGWTLRNRPT